MSDVKVSETCWCGTQTSVEGVTWEQARRHVVAWRNEHRHREQREERHLGFAATGYSQELGWPSLNRQPVGFAR